MPSFKVAQTNVEKMHFCRLSQNWVLKVDIGTHLRDNHRHLFLWDLELFWPSFKVESMHFCWLSHNLVLTIDLGTHLRDKHGHLFLWYLELFCPSLKVGDTRIKICTFSTFSELTFQSGFRYTFEKYPWTPIFMRFIAILACVQGWSNQG